MVHGATASDAPQAGRFGEEELLKRLQLAPSLRHWRKIRASSQDKSAALNY